MSEPSADSEPLTISHWPLCVIVLILLIVAAVLAITSLVGDSITFDETSHLTSGYSYLRMGDFRLSPDHPPLAKMWCAWPLLLVDNKWPGPETGGWRSGNSWEVGRAWLFELNDGEQLLIIARCMMVVLLLGVCLCIFAVGRMLFGVRAGLLALILAVFSPTFLAHGRLVTTDLPMTLGVLVTLLTFVRLLERITWGRLVLSALSLSALSLTKFSWPLLLPPLILMGAVVIFRRQPTLCLLFEGRPRGRLLVSRFNRAGVMLIITLLIGVFVWAAIWTCFGWRYSPLLDDSSDKAKKSVLFESDPPETAKISWKWELPLTDPQGRPMHDPATNFARWARKHRFLPESYVYGLAFTRRTTMHRKSYLMGEISQTGRILYFPIAFAIKTPIAVMLLLVAGLSGIAARRLSVSKDPVLIVGLVSFTIIYTLFAVTGNINIGHRHILPIYPAVIVFAGASTAWINSRTGKALIVLALAWLIGANLWIHPHYLSYFNELIGGPKRGHLYLIDSNIDWGQDIKRLAEYAGSRPGETIKLAYFGSVNPSRYGFECEKLHSFFDWPGKPARPTAGTYVLSVTQMVGVYDPIVTDTTWERPYNLKLYRRLCENLARPLPEDASEEDHRRRTEEIQSTEQLQLARLVSRLRRRLPDERIGYSLFVYRLTQEEVDRLVSP